MEWCILGLFINTFLSASVTYDVHWLHDCEWWMERMWMWHILRYYPSFCLKELRITTEKLNQDSQSPCWDLNLAPTQKKPRFLNNTPLYCWLFLLQMTSHFNYYYGLWNSVNTFINVSDTPIFVYRFSYNRHDTRFSLGKCHSQFIVWNV